MTRDLCSKHLKGITHTTFVLLILISQSCYPSSYTVSERGVTGINKRNESIRASIRQDLKIGERYVEYGFGSESVIKPTSFKRLDSLFGAYYAEETKAGASRNVLLALKNEIEKEQQKVLADTIYFQYQKQVFFGIASGDSTTIFYSDFVLDANSNVVFVDIKYIFNVHSRLSSYYKAYAFRESFLDFGYVASQEEIQLYNFFDAAIENILNPETKGNFIGHALNIMRAANQQGGIATEPLIKQQIINVITSNVNDYKPIKWSKVYTSLDENDVLLSYEVDHDWQYMDPFNMQHNLMKRFILNPYFEITQIETIDRLRD